MKFEWIVDCKVNEIEGRLIIDMVIGIVALVAGAFFDPIAKHFTINHQAGFGPGQTIWCAFWGLYIFWTVSQLRKWREK